MKVAEIRRRYLDFFARRGHKIVPSAPLVPENDPTTLFTGSGMQPLVPYLAGKKHPLGRRLANSQKCFRAEDIEEVGDNRHTTFFEMLGNWSLGDYFKQEQLRWIWEFLTDEIGLDPARLYVTCFAGDEKVGVPRDTESAEIWRELFAARGISAEIVHIGSEEDGACTGMRGGRIFYYDSAKNWWSRAGKPENMPEGEMGGPDSEIFYDFGIVHDEKFGAHCHPNCDCGRFMEIGNSVFMQYLKRADGSFAELPQRNVDFGGGLERLAAAVNDNPDVFAIDVFAPFLEALEKLSGRKYADEKFVASFRVTADHLRAAVFLIADGVLPGNKEQGYVLRRLLRRAIRHLDLLGVGAGKASDLSRHLMEVYAEIFEIFRSDSELITEVITEEEKKFRQTLNKGLREFEKVLKASDSPENFGQVLEKSALVFDLFQSYGFPTELTLEEASRRNIAFDEEKVLRNFRRHLEEHRDKSRVGGEKKFAGGLADDSEATTKLHTATHLMLAALRKFLGEHVTQKGSNITAERARFDFTHPEKVPAEILRQVEKYVNDAIEAEAEVTVEKMPKEKARQEGVTGAFWDKYPDVVTVYTVRDKSGKIWSRELCGGPHVANTRQIAGTFKITKEQSSSAGVRRIKAIIE